MFINKKIKIKNNNSLFLLEPCDSLKINCTVEFPKPIGKESIFLGGSYKDIYEEVMDAKTFCFFEDIELMKKNGLAQGGTLDNAVVIKDGEVINSKFTNNNNYFVRHKTLDVIGDFALLGLNIVGNLSIYFPGHELNRLAMNEIFSDYSNYRIHQFNKTSNYITRESILTL